MNKNKHKLKIAIIGSGISGLTSGYLLSKKHEVYLFEKNDYVGGHTHTHKIKENTNSINVDSGFIVYNENTYPNFIKLLDILNVERQHTEMGFSVKSNGEEFEYAGNSINSIFSQRKNIFKPSFLMMIYDILKFNYKSKKDLKKISTNITLKEYLDSSSYSSEFIDKYIIPMGAAIWSTSPELMLQVPAVFFIRFFKNHGLLNVTNRPQWWVVKNGSNQYVKEIIKKFKKNIKLNTKISSIKRKNNGVEVSYGNNKEFFDSVIIATHSDQALSLIDDLTDKENDILSKIKYQKNTALLHTDTSILPNRRLAWSSWNYLINHDQKKIVTLTYNMNILQTLKSNETYCVTINDSTNIDRSKILKEINYSHPLFTIDSVDAQKRKDEICGKNNTYFCGAYWGYGFHEDGVNSALDVCNKFGLSLDD